MTSQNQFIPYQFIPFIHKIEQVNTDMIYNVSNLSNDSNVMTSTNINQPLFSLGFHSFIHRTKSAMEITNKLETTNNFYYVVNPFEHNVSNYKDDISNTTLLYFPKTNENKILSRAFYKMWEILMIFNIADIKNLTMVALAEGPGSFIQAVLNYRDKFFDITNDMIYSMTIQPENSMYIEMSKDMIEYYNKNNKKLLNPIKTFKKDIADKDPTKITGDVTKVKTIHYLKKQLNGKYADLVTADGGFKWINENYQEQESYMLILGEIISALSIQAKNGSFILKIFETFTHLTIKMIYLLTSFYEEVYIYKPFFSRSTNSERYIICKKFKYDQVADKNMLEKKIKHLEKTLEQMDTRKFIVDIFPNFILSPLELNVFKYTNTLIVNTQQIMINQLVQFIKSNNYFGDDYHMYRDKQIIASKWWIETFFTKIKTDFSKMIKDTSHYNSSELNLFVNKMI